MEGKREERFGTNGFFKKIIDRIEHE